MVSIVDVVRYFDYKISESNHDTSVRYKESVAEMFRFTVEQPVAAIPIVICMPHFCECAPVLKDCIS